jgi:hypothetical protein
MANVRFLDQVSVGVFQSTSGGGGTGDVSVQNGSFAYEPGYLIYSSGSNIVQSTSLIYVNDVTQTIILSGQLSSSGGITGSFFGTSSYALTASYALNAGAGAGFPYSGSAVITGSLLVTEGITGSLQGTASFATTASYVNNLGSSNYTQSFTNQSTWTVIHNLGTRYVLVQTYDSNFDEMIPQNIDLTDSNTATITFPTLESGVAVVTVGGALQNGSPQSASYALNADMLDGRDSSVFATTGSVTFTGNQIVTGSTRGNVTSLTISSNTASLNLSTGNFFTLQLVSGSNTHINPSNILPGQTSLITLYTTGSATVSFPSSVKQPSGSAYVPTTSTGVDILTLASIDSTSLYVIGIKNLI